jgi:hypothetical protein
MARGARACLVEREGFAGDASAIVDPLKSAGLSAEGVGTYAGLRRDSGAIAAAYHDHPSRHLDVLAITLRPTRELLTAAAKLAWKALDPGEAQIFGERISGCVSYCRRKKSSLRIRREGGKNRIYLDARC